MYTESGTTTLFSQGRKQSDETALRCSFYKKLYHTQAECVVKHLHLKPALEKRLEKKRVNQEKKQSKQKARDTIIPLEHSLNQDKSPAQAIHSKFVIRGYATKTAYNIVK